MIVSGHSIFICVLRLRYGREILCVTGAHSVASARLESLASSTLSYAAPSPTPGHVGYFLYRLAICLII